MYLPKYFCTLIQHHWASCWSALPDHIPIVVEDLPFVMIKLTAHLPADQQLHKRPIDEEIKILDIPL